MLTRRICRQSSALLEPSNTTHENQVAPDLVLPQIMHSNPSGKYGTSQIYRNLFHGWLNRDVRVGLEDIFMDSHPGIGDNDIDMLEDGFRRSEETQLV